MAQDIYKSEINIPEPEGFTPGSLESLLGQAAIRNTVEPFVDYVETTVAVFEQDGSLIGEPRLGNSYCQTMMAADASGCIQAGRDAALAAMESGRQEERSCSGGLALCASPIVALGRSVGAVVGAVSEVPSDEKTILQAARKRGLEFDTLWFAASKAFHKPDYLYIAARSHLDRLAATLGKLYEKALETVNMLANVVDREKLLAKSNRRLRLLQSFTYRGISQMASGTSLDGLAAEVADALGYEFCSVFVVSDDGKKLELVSRHAPVEDDLASQNESDIHSLANHEFRDCPPGRAFLKGEQVVVDNIADYRGYARVRHVAGQLGTNSMVATPLEYRGERIGAMVIHTKDTSRFTREELDFLKTVAAQVSLIAGSAQVYRSLQESEKRYRDLYNSAADWMYTLDESGVILNCNDTMVDALGFSREEIVGRRIYELETPEDEIKAKKAIKETAREGFFSAERTFVRKDGSRAIMALHARVIRDRDAGSYHWFVTGRDITQRKEAERRIDLLAAAVDNTHDSVIVSDLKGDIVSINGAGARMFGSTPPEFAGRHMGEFWSEKNPEDLREEIIRASLEDGSWEGQMWYRRPDGSDFPVFVSSSLVLSDDGEPIAIVGISRDLSEEQRMTREILRRNRELAVLNAVATTAAQSLDLHSILQSCAGSIVNSIGYDAGSIYLLDSDQASLSVAANLNTPDEVLKYIGRQKVGEGFAGSVAAAGKPLFLDDLRNSPFGLPGEAGEHCPVTSLGGLPIISRDRILGVITVSSFNRHEFSEQEKALLKSVAQTLGVAIENARLFGDITRAKAEWEATFDAMTNGVSIHDRDYNILRANKALATMLGTTTEELVGKKCYEVFHNRREPVADCPHTKAMAEGKNYSTVIEDPYLGRTVHLSADPIHDDNGNVIGTVHDLRDITEQEQLREQLNQSEKLRALGEMAGGVAHDFNNFLTVILGNTQLLLSSGGAGADSEGESGMRDSLKTIQRAATDAAETVRRIQEFTRVRTTRSFVTVDLNSVIANAIEVSRPRWRDEAEARGVRIGLDVKLDELPPVNGNESELGEVMLNLILNASDALPAGGTISITSEATDDGWVEVRVADSGQGMDDEVRKRIFEPFFSTKGPSGSGLGLSLVYGIVNRHGGDIMVESQAGEGSAFTVRLPVATVADLSHIGQGPAREEEGCASISGRILVIDDEEMIRALLANILASMGQEVVIAETGSEGIWQFEKDMTFDLVLTDLGMPDMSGWEVVERVKKLSPQTPVALITGWGDQLDPERMKNSGVDKVIAKPFKVEEVRQLIVQTLKGKK